jgi:hypothetical protein
MSRRESAMGNPDALLKARKTMRLWFPTTPPCLQPCARRGGKKGTETRTIPLFMNLFMVNMKLFMNQIQLCGMHVAARVVAEKLRASYRVPCLQFIEAAYTIYRIERNDEKFRYAAWRTTSRSPCGKNFSVARFRCARIRPSRKLKSRNLEWMLAKLK